MEPAKGGNGQAKLAPAKKLKKRKKAAQVPTQAAVGDAQVCWSGQGSLHACSAAAARACLFAVQQCLHERRLG